MILHQLFNVTFLQIMGYREVTGLLEGKVLNKNAC